MLPKKYSVCVIGGGAAGVMAVLRTVLNNDDCLFFPGSPKNKKRARATWVRKIENVPGYSHYNKGIEEPNAQTLKWITESSHAHKLHWKKNLGVEKLAKLDDGSFQITDTKGEVYLADFVLLCTGVMDVQPEINGAIEPIFDYANAQIVDYCLICDGHHTLGKKLVVLGHTDSAAWVGIILKERYELSRVSILTNGKEAEFGAETTALIHKYQFEVQKDEISEVVGEDKGKILKGFRLKSGLMVESDIAFVALGMIIYNELAKQVGAELDTRGFVKASEVGATSVPGLYVAGDLMSNTKKQVYVAWDTAVNASNNINLELRKRRRVI